MNTSSTIKHSLPILPSPERLKYQTNTSKHDMITNTDATEKEDKDSQTETVCIVSEEELSFLNDIKKFQDNFKNVLDLVKAEYMRTKNAVIETIEIDSDNENRMVINEETLGSIVQQSKHNKAVISKVLNIIKLLVANKNMAKRDKDNALQFFGKLITQILTRSSAVPTEGTNVQKKYETNTVETDTGDKNIYLSPNVEFLKQNQAGVKMPRNIETDAHPHIPANIPIASGLTITSLPQTSANQTPERAISKLVEPHSNDNMAKDNSNNSQVEFQKTFPVTNTASPLNLGNHQKVLTNLNQWQPNENIQNSKNFQNVKSDQRENIQVVANNPKQFVHQPGLLPKLRAQRKRYTKTVPPMVHARDTRLLDAESGKALPSQHPGNAASAMHALNQNNSNYAPPYPKNRHEKVWNAQMQLAEHWSQHQLAVRGTGSQGVSLVGPPQVAQNPMPTVPMPRHFLPPHLAQQHLQSPHFITPQQVFDQRMYLEMELQQQAWQSRLTNYPNADWSSAVQPDNT